MKVQMFPESGYITYLIIDEESQEAAVVDPFDADKIAIAVQENNASLTKVLNTRFGWYRHEVYAKLSEKFNDLQVYSGDDRIERLTCKVEHNDTFNIGELRVRCLATPSYDIKCICYYIRGDSDTRPAVFTGDTLCVGGCGKFFGGTAQQMYTAFIMTLGSLPDETEVYCLDDFETEQRLEFAEDVEPENQEVAQRLEWVRTQLEKKNPIVPSTIWDEKLTNPFMRAEEQSVLDHTGYENPVEAIRSLKREWYTGERF